MNSRAKTMRIALFFDMEAPILDPKEPQGLADELPRRSRESPEGSPLGPRAPLNISLIRTLTGQSDP